MAAVRRGRQYAAMTEGAAPRRMTARRLLVVALVLVLGAAAAALLRYQPLRQSGDLGLSGDMDVVTVEEFNETGAHILRYVDGGYVSYAVTLHNTGPLPVTVTGVALPAEQDRRLLQPVAAGLAADGSPEAGDMATFEPVSLAPGEEQQVVIQARFDNCEYYTERAIEVLDEQAITFRIAGIPRTATVSFDRALLVRSPTINRCEDRTLDRSENRRTQP